MAWGRCVLFVVYSAAVLSFLVYSPLLLQIHPQSYRIPLPDLFEGPLRANNFLSKATHLFEGEINGPESIVQFKGDLYTGISDGRIIRIRGDEYSTVARMENNECEGIWDMSICGRPLGLRFDTNGYLYAVDAYYGIKRINITNGSSEKVNTVFSTKGKLVDGREIVFIDDMVIEEGAGLKGGHVYYVSDASANWPLELVNFAFLEHDYSGRILRFDADSGETRVLVGNLSFPNGVELTDDKDALLFNEFNNRRIMKHYLKGPKTGQTEVFLDKLPGEPDNLKRSASERESYWVGLYSARVSSKPSLVMDTFSDKPYIRKAATRLLYHLGASIQWLGQTFNYIPLKSLGFNVKTGHLVVNHLKEYGMVIEVSREGNILRSLHSPDGLTSSLAEAREVKEGNDRVLYLGSYFNNYLGKLILPN